MKLIPLGERVLVEPIEDELKKGKIIIPDTAKEKPQKGKVVSVGKGILNDDGSRTSLEVKEGDTVLYGKYSGTEIELDEKQLLILEEKEILAILEK